MRPARPLPEGPLVAFYGDDFTGSSASMEVMAAAGLPTVLFLETPTPERLLAFEGYRGIGLAGTARSRTPEWMDASLPTIFAFLESLGAPMVHYKVCSTFDSAPHVGSIGRALDIAARRFQGWFPMVVGEPGMGRFQSFGHLFALAGSEGFRLDRHPTMAHHPVTPMDEADLAVHLSRQTDLPIGLVDFVSAKRGRGDERLETEIAAGARVVSIDVLDRETLEEAGRLIWERGSMPTFGVGSQGFEAALVGYWQAAGLLPSQASMQLLPARGRIACVSGSVSPVTARQIADASQNGFVPLRLDARLAIEEVSWEREAGRMAEQALAILGEGGDPLIYSASGPDDPAVFAFREAIASSGADSGTVNRRIGRGLGRLLDQIVREAGLSRVVISGGDTSSHAATELGIDALTMLAPVAPGSPLCRAHSATSARDGLEIALKGGQVGADDFFRRVRDGERRDEREPA